MLENIITYYHVIIIMLAGYISWSETEKVQSLCYFYVLLELMS